MSLSKEVLDLVDESKVWDLEDTMPLVSDYDLDKERWGKGKGGEDDESYPIGENNYTINELLYEGFNDYDQDLVKDLLAMKPGDKMKFGKFDSLYIDNIELSIKGTFPVLSVKVDNKDLLIKTKIEISQEVWYERD